MFKEPIDPKAEQFYIATSELLKASNELITVPPFIFKYIFTKHWKELIQASDIAFGFADDVVEEKRQQLERKISNTNDIDRSDDRVDLLSYVISTGKLSRGEANVVMMELLLGGVDTVTLITEIINIFEIA